MIYVFWSCPNKEEAKRVVVGLLDKRLIACASMIPGVTSVYRWKEKVEEGEEIKVVLKTQAPHFDAICKYIVENGSYEVPEIVQIDVARSNPKYLSWVKEET